jgi:hypothetical protein
MFKIKATVKRVGQTAQVSEKFSKRELVVEIADDKYPQVVSFEFTQDKCALLDGIMEGQEVEVSFALRGREWTNENGDVRVFNTLNGFRVEGGSAPAAATAAVVVDTTEDDESDLPF